MGSGLEHQAFALRSWDSFWNLMVRLKLIFLDGGKTESDVTFWKKSEACKNAMMQVLGNGIWGSVLRFGGWLWNFKGGFQMFGFRVRVWDLGGWFWDLGIDSLFWRSILWKKVHTLLKYIPVLVPVLVLYFVLCTWDFEKTRFRYK